MFDSKDYILLKDESTVTKNGFYKLAGRVVDADCRALDGSKLEGEDRESIVFEMAYNMMLGSRKTRGKYIAIGIIVGVSATYAVQKIRTKFKKED